MAFDVLLFIVSIVAGGVAGVAGFGIGSILTPVLSLAIGTKLAVALVSIPHLVATAIRLSIMRAHVEKSVLIGFGTMSAAGGLVGALLHTRVSSPALTIAFGTVLIFAGFMGVTGYSARLKFTGIPAQGAGIVSGMLGGLVGNQGSIRSAAMLGFGLAPLTFVATNTAVGLMVDFARVPVYMYHDGHVLMAEYGKFIALTTIGVVVGTLLGSKVLRRLPEHAFRRGVSALIFVLGVFILVRELA